MIDEMVSIILCLNDDVNSEKNDLIKEIVAKFPKNSVELLSEQECVNLKPVARFIFVFFSFHGNAFNHLKSVSAKIISAKQMVTFIRSNELDFKKLVGLIPVYSTALKDCTISCSNMDAKLKKDLYEKIRMMQGKVSLILTSEVTHLITNKVGSEKYYGAIQMNIQILMSEWIDAVWNDSENINNSSYEVKSLTGLVICTSGFDKKEKINIKNQIQANGGIFLDTLQRDKTTHLIMKEFGTDQSEKYQKAILWNIRIVSIDWLNTSIVNKHCLKDETNMNNTCLTNIECNQIFSNKNFQLVDFDSDRRKKIEMELIENGAVIIKSSNTDLLIVDHFLYPITVKKTLLDKQKAVTHYWLRKCIQMNKLLDLKGSEFYQPIPFVDDCKPLHDCVITLSGFKAAKKELLKKLCELMGAFVQDFLILKLKNNQNESLKLNTHLVRVKKFSGPKFNAAKEYGLPIVGYRWILCACLLGIKPDVLEFTLNNQSLIETNDTMEVN